MRFYIFLPDMKDVSYFKYIIQSFSHTSPRRRHVLLLPIYHGDFESCWTNKISSSYIPWNIYFTYSSQNIQHNQKFIISEYISKLLL